MKFQQLGITSSIYVHQWILTLFVVSLPIETSCVIWDNLFFYGLNSLIDFATGLMELFADAIQRVSDVDSLNSLLKNLRDPQSLCTRKIGSAIVRLGLKHAENSPTNLREYIREAN